MPYDIEQRDGEWVILKDDKVVGHSKSKKDAEASVRARLAGEFGPVKEVWNIATQSFDKVQEGGPGSGRYPAGSSGGEGGVSAEKRAEYSSKSQSAVNTEDAKYGILKVEWGYGGIDGSAIMHRENVEGIRGMLKDGDTYRFRDEQKDSWAVEKLGKNTYGIKPGLSDKGRVPSQTFKSVFSIPDSYESTFRANERRSIGYSGGADSADSM